MQRRLGRHQVVSTGFVDRSLGSAAFHLGIPDVVPMVYNAKMPLLVKGRLTEWVMVVELCAWWSWIPRFRG